MEYRIKPIILVRERGLGPFECFTERWPWLQLIDAINALDSKFLGWPSFRLEFGGEVEIYKHLDVVFPRDDKSVVIIRPKSQYAEQMLRRALAWLDFHKVCKYIDERII